jgi:Prokaryotic phospholipase A2
LSGRGLVAAAAAAFALALFAPAPAMAANGCGPSGLGFLVPDRPLGFDFSAPCATHDACYAAPWRERAPSRAMAKHDCDTGFLSDLDLVCVTGGRRVDLCLRLARDYHRAVRSWLGDLAYAASQA